MSKQLKEETTHFHEGMFEYVSSEPLAAQVKMPGHVSREDAVRRIIRGHELARAAEAAGMETFEESEDFDVGDDYEPSSPWEEQFDPEVGLGRYDPDYYRTSQALFGPAEQRGPEDPPAPASGDAPKASHAAEKPAEGDGAQ